MITVIHKALLAYFHKTSGTACSAANRSMMARLRRRLMGRLLINTAVLLRNR